MLEHQQGDDVALVRGVLRRTAHPRFDVADSQLLEPLKVAVARINMLPRCTCLPCMPVTYQPPQREFNGVRR